MNLTPILEESLHVYLRTKAYRMVHLLYVAAVAVVAVLVWPSRGLMVFFSTEAVPSAFHVVLILELLLLSGISIYAGMDRVAGNELIRYSEWLGRTPVRVRTLMTGKLTAAVLHTVLLIALSLPFLVISAGPAGIPLRAVFSSLFVLGTATMLCRLVGMLISVVGEDRDAIRIVGSWVFLALLYMGTIRILQPLNPIIAVSRQQNELSPLVSTLDPVSLGSHPALEPVAYMGTLMIGVAALYGFAMARMQKRLGTRSTNA